LCPYHVPDALFESFCEFSSIHPAFAASFAFSITEPFKISHEVAQCLPFHLANENSDAVFEAKRDSYRTL